MGILSKIKKVAKKALNFAAKTTGVHWLYKAGKPIWDNLTGKTARKDLAAQQEEQLRLQGEQSKLNAANEIDNVTQFDESTDPSFVGTEGRRKKRSAGAYASGIGLQI